MKSVHNSTGDPLSGLLLNKKILYGQQEGKCNGCKVLFPYRNMTVDHLIAQNRGGPDDPENLQLLCGACNSMKGDGTQEQLIVRLKEAKVLYRQRKTPRLCYLCGNMIRRKTDGGWFFFTQDDHAKLSAQIMSLWGGGDFFFPGNAEELLFAISEHDCGWKKADSLPLLNSNGEPEDFTEVSPPRQCEIWMQSFQRHLATHPGACVLIALHFNKFNKRVLSRCPNKWSLSLDSEIEEFVTKTLDIESVERIPADTAKNLKLLQTGDAISLALCHGWESFEIGDVPLENGGVTTVRLKMTGENSYSTSPWPFSRNGRLDFETEFIRTRREKFDSDEQLRREINGSTKEKTGFFLLPADL